jgi:dipeptidyl aminopeptidase/acylaminoacyl peptidase
MFLPPGATGRRNYGFLFFPFVFALLSTNCRLHNKRSYDYCYASGTTLILFSVKDNKASRIKLPGSDPSLSPDGTMLAYTNEADSHRRIALMDLDNDQTRILDSNCTNCWGPVWSPDGKYIAYDAYTQPAAVANNSTQPAGANDNTRNPWSIAVIDPDNGDTVIVSKNTYTRLGAFSPTWSADSKMVIFQDMQSVHIVDLKGNPVRDIPDSDILPDPNISSDSKFLLTPDEKKIVFNMEIDDSLADHPPSAIFAFDTLNKKTIRLSPKGYDCFQPFLKDGRVFFDATRNSAEKYNIYSVDLNGKDLKLEFRNRLDFTYKRED